MANSILEHFAELPDSRVERTRRHRLQDIVTIAICAVICGAEGWTDIELFGKAKESWFRTFLELPNGIPSHDTFGRVISAHLQTDSSAHNSYFRRPSLNGKSG